MDAQHASSSRRLSVAEAANYLGLAVSTLNKRRVTGDTPAFVKLGRRVLYDSKDLDEWLAAHRRRSTSDAARAT